MRGHIRKRGSTWSVFYDRPRDPISGDRRKTSKGGFRTKKDAERWAVEMLTTLEQGTYVEASKQTLAEFLLNGRRDGGGGLSARSVRYAHMVLRAALADAVRWGRVVRNIADSATAPRKSATRAKTMKTWTANELRCFLDHVSDDRLFAAFRLAAATGMRRGEVLGLRWRDVDFVAGRLAVTQTLIAPDYRVQFSTPKTEKGRRSVPLDSATIAALRQHQAGQQLEAVALGSGWASLDLVFCQEDGGPLNPHRFTEAFERHIKTAELPRIRLHDLRHTWATLALQSGIHPKVVSEVLGHSTIAITLDTYSHAIPTMQETAVELIAAMMANEPS